MQLHYFDDYLRPLRYGYVIVFFKLSTSAALFSYRIILRKGIQLLLIEESCGTLKTGLPEIRGTLHSAEGRTNGKDKK